MGKNKVYLEKDSFPARAAVTCFILAIIFRAIGSLTQAHLSDRLFLIFQAAVPMVSCALLIVCIRFFGKKHFNFAILPILLGAVFFALRIFTADNIAMRQFPILHVILCIVLYVIILMVLVLTLYSVIPTKWISTVLFAALFLYHLVVEDYPAIMYETASVSSAMLETSVLCILLGLFFTCLGMRTFVTATTEKSKDVVPPIPGNPLNGPKPMAKSAEEPACASAANSEITEAQETTSVAGTQSAGLASAESSPITMPETLNEATSGKQDQTLPSMFAETEGSSESQSTLDTAPSEAAVEETVSYSPEMTEISEAIPSKAVITPLEGEDDSFGAKVGKLWDKLGHIDDKN